MKIFSFFLVVCLFNYSYAQISDKNSIIIDNYFQMTNEKHITEGPRNLDAGVQSYVNVVQIGNKNSTYINSLQTGDSQVVNQTGTQNNYEYYNYYSKENSNLNVNQEGTLNSLQVFGENSLMKNAIINQKSDFQGLIIKNYTN